MDKEGEFPKELINFMLSPEVALHLIFIPAEIWRTRRRGHGYSHCFGRLAKMALAIATSFLAMALAWTL
jgi:hypothetical protein